MHRQAAAVAEAAVGADLREPLDVLRAIATEVTLDLLRLDGLAQLHDLVVGQVLDVGVRIDAGVLDDLRRRGLADPVDVGEPHLHALVGRDVYPRDASHLRLPLPLLVTRVGADNEHDAAPPNDSAALTHRLYGRSYLHPLLAGSYPITFGEVPHAP